MRCLIALSCGEAEGCRLRICMFEEVEVQEALVEGRGVGPSL